MRADDSGEGDGGEIGFLIEEPALHQHCIQDQPQKNEHQGYGGLIVGLG